MRGKKSDKGWLVALGVVLVAGGLVAWQVIGRLDAYQKKVTALHIAEVDLGEIQDGVYPGVCDLDMVSVKLEVTVKEHHIEDIRLIEHKKGTGAPAEALLQKVVKEQAVDIDLVSGSTASSKAILKAVENALTGHPEG